MKVLLVDDHPLILAALQSVIQGFGDDVTVIGVETAEGARQVLHEVAGHERLEHLSDRPRVLHEVTPAGPTVQRVPATVT